MVGERRLIWKVMLGFGAGVISAAIIYSLNRSGFYISWAPIVAAALIGAVPGTAEKRGNKIVLGVILACVGWISGELFSRLLFHSMATWIFVGGFIGLTAGIVEKSLKSMIGGIVLGALGGLMGVAAGMSTIMLDPLRDYDLQVMGIFGAAIFINLLLGLKRPKILDATGATGGGDDKPKSSDEK